ncbi:membrane protein, partial [Yersinia pestis subsp. microtus bv. Ulegeica]
NKSFKNKNIIFTVSLLDGGKCFVEINSAKFSNLLDAIIDVSNKYDINVSSADIYLHQDDDDGYVAGKIIFFK